jgi:hypothetical protein
MVRAQAGASICAATGLLTSQAALRSTQSSRAHQREPRYSSTHAVEALA